MIDRQKGRAGNPDFPRLVGRHVAAANKARARRGRKTEGAGVADSMAFPREHWRSLRTNNMLERIMREIRRQTRVVGAFPDGHSASVLVSARLRRLNKRS
jgi:transposase-like protein